MSEAGHVEVQGLRIAYRRRGSGPPLLLVHGGLCDGRVWRPQLEGLSDEFTLVAWDAPGCGSSTDPPESFRLADYADALAGFVDCLGLRRPCLVGHSFGGALLLELHRRHPETAGALIIVGGYAGWAGSLPPADVERRLRFALEAADWLAGGFDPRSMPGLFSDALSAEAADELAEIMSTSRPVATRTMALGMAEADLRGALALVDVPTLLVYGDADERSRLDVAEQLHRGIAGSTLEVMPDAGHACNLEFPDEFNALVRGFLRSGGTP
jgi:pimeloyl-ACP methyl ester carboxylesterase